MTAKTVELIKVKTKSKTYILTEKKFVAALKNSAKAANTIRDLKITVDMFADRLDFQETVEDVLKNSLEALPLVKKIKLPCTKHDSKPYLAANLMVSDLHAGEIVNKEAMEGFNEYDFSIFNDRLGTLTEEVLRLTDIFRYGYEINTLYVDLLGDLVTGTIHEELLKTNAAAILPIATQTAFLLAQMLAAFAAYYNRIIVSSVPGNHGRLTKKVEFKQPENNIDWLVSQMVAGFLVRYVKTNRITFNIPSAASCIVEKENWRFLLTHGNQFKGGSFGGIPYYTIERFRGKELVRRRKQGGFDFIEIGHNHTPAGLAMNRILMNGSMIGDTEFSSGKSFESFPPTQKFFLISHKYGATLPVDLQLDDPSPSSFVYSFSSGNLGSQLASLETDVSL